MPTLDQLPAGAAAAAAGGLVGALIVRGPLIDRIAAGVTGAALAWFAGPVVGPFVHAGLEALDKALLGDVVTLYPAAVQSFTGFMLGTTGLAVPATVHRLIDAWRARAARHLRGG